MSESVLETIPSDEDVVVDEKNKENGDEKIIDDSAVSTQSAVTPVQCPPHVPPHVMGHDFNNPSENNITGRGKCVMKPRFGVKVPSRSLTSQIVTQDEIAQELLERSLKKYPYQNLESNELYFTMKLTNSFPNRLPSQSATKVATSTLTNQSCKSEVLDDEDTRIKDVNELLAILDGNSESSNVDKKNTVRKHSKSDSKLNISPYKFIKMYPELEKELALKQLEEFSSKSRKKKDDSTNSNKDVVQNKIPFKRMKKSKVLENNNNIEKNKLNNDNKIVTKGKPGRKRKIVLPQHTVASPKKRRGGKSSDVEVLQSTTVADVSQITEVPIVENGPLPLVPPVKDNRYIKKYMNKRLTSRSDEDVDSSGNDVLSGSSVIEGESDSKLVNETIVENSSPKIKKTVLKKGDIVVNSNNSRNNIDNSTAKHKGNDGNDNSTNGSPTKKKTRVMREIDKLLGDEGAINMLYSVEQKRTPGSTPNRRGILPSTRRKKKDLLLKTRLVKNAVLRLSSSPTQSLGKTALRVRRDSSLLPPPPAIPLSEGSSAKEEMPERKLSVESLQSASLNSPVHSPSFAYPTKLNVPAEASRIIRRHSSSSSYSSRSNSPRRPSTDADRSSLISTSIPSSPEKGVSDTSGSSSPKKYVLSSNKNQDGVSSLSERAKLFLDAVNDPLITLNELSEKAEHILNMKYKEIAASRQDGLSKSSENSCPIVFKKDIRNLVKSRLSAEVSKSLKKNLSEKFIRTKKTTLPGPVSEIQNKFMKALSRQDGGATSVSSTSTSPSSDPSTLHLGNETPSSQLPHSSETSGYSNLIKTSSGDSQKKRDGEEKHRSSVRQNAGAYSYKEISLRRYEHLVQIILTPVSTKMKNAFNCQVFKEITNALNCLRKDDSCRVVLFTSTGSAFCLGVDLTALIHPTQEKRKAAAVELVISMKNFIKSLATFTKPLIAGVHGAAVGLGVTMLPFFDMVFASDKATFHTPYARLGQIPEGAATVTLPQMLGNAVTSELLFGCRKLTASEALHFGLVTRILWPDRFQEELIPLIRGIATQSSQSMEATKALLRHGLCTKLDDALMSEAQFLIKHWQSNECQNCFKQYLEEETPTLQK